MDFATRSTVDAEIEETLRATRLLAQESSSAVANCQTKEDEFCSRFEGQLQEQLESTVELKAEIARLDDTLRSLQDDVAVSKEREIASDDKVHAQISLLKQ